MQYNDLDKSQGRTGDFLPFLIKTHLLYKMFQILKQITECILVSSCCNHDLHDDGMYTVIIIIINFDRVYTELTDHHRSVLNL